MRGWRSYVPRTIRWRRCRYGVCWPKPSIPMPERGGLATDGGRRTAQHPHRGRYPATLLNGVMLRIRAEREVTRGRAAILKAYYLRNAHQGCPEEVLQVQLNEASNYLPYVLGRLFSVLEAIQHAANPGINADQGQILQQCGGHAGQYLPLLLNLAQKHLRKLDTGMRVYYDRQLCELTARIQQAYPTRLTLAEQGAFQLGYYHQTQKRYTKKEDVQNA